MPNIQLPFHEDHLTTYLSKPNGLGPFPGVVVIHDALGMSNDVHKQCDWLASEGYLTAAPDLFKGKTLFSCIFRVIREFKNRRGQLFEKVEIVRQHLLNHPTSNGRVGIIGFCFGGGFAVLLSADHGFDVSSINYGGSLSKDADILLRNACPIVASYGELDRGSQGVAEQLEQILTKYGIDHDVMEYKNTDHAFMNDHDPNEVPLFIKFIAYAFGGGAYHEASTKHARKRILAFFEKTLKVAEM